MTLLHSNWRALSIQQPWIDLILERRKTIEVRYWRGRAGDNLLKRRGGFLLHASRNVDWKTFELLGYENVHLLPRQQIMGYAEIDTVVTLTNENRLAYLYDHWVLHPFSGAPLGEIGRASCRFKNSIACGGGPFFFSLPASTHAAINQQLELIGVNPLSDPSRLG